MGRPLAYEYKGFVYDGKSYPIWSDDMDATQFYVMPPSLTVASDSTGPKVTVSVCQDLTVPAVDGLGNLVPYIPDDVLDAIKKEYGPRVGPLPVSSGGQVMIVGPQWTRRGLAVHKPWAVDQLSYEGMSPEQIKALEDARRWYEEDGIQVPLTSVLPGGLGFALEVPKMVGSNIGAEIPIAFVVLGADNVKRFKGLLDAPGGGIINGQLLYHYVGTSRPWAIQLKADLSKVHEFIDEKLSAGYWWARADIHNTVEEMHEKHIIELTIWDENDNITTKYKPEKIFDTILNFILNKAFNYYPEIKPEKSEAQDNGSRWWWWSGSYSRRTSTVDLSTLINIKITINGKSEPIPVSMGMFLRVPKYSNCNSDNMLHETRKEFLRHIFSMDHAKLLEARDSLNIKPFDYKAHYDGLK